MPRLTFERELASLRESLVRMGTLVESQIEAALDALRRRDGSAAEKVRTQDQYLNELFRQIREQVFMVISTQQPVARDLRYLMGLQYIASELERMGDYAVRIARMTGTLVALPDRPLRAEFGLMGELAIGRCTTSSRRSSTRTSRGRAKSRVETTRSTVSTTASSRTW